MEVYLIAVDDGLALLVGRHERGEAPDDVGVLVFDQDVAQLGRAHLLEFCEGLPFSGRIFVIFSTCLLNQLKARRELVLGQIVRPHQADAILGACAWVGPAGHPGGLIGT